MKEVNLAVVGLGYWGPNILRNAWELEGAQVGVICDRDEEALARQARRYGQSKLVTDFDEVLADDEVDAVCIVTPISTHYAMVKAALLAGKHVFVEKPMASSVKECDELIEIAAEREPGAHAGPHVPLLPAGARHEGAARERRDRQALLRHVEPREPRHPPARRQRRARPGAARLLDPPLLARPPVVPARDRARHDRARHVRRRLRRRGLRERHARPPRAVVARAHQAAPNRARGVGEDDRVRGHEPRAGARLRPRRRDRRAEELRRVPALLPHRRRADAAPRSRTSRCAWSSRTS